MLPEDAAYIDSLGPLPEPMTPEEEVAAFSSFRNGGSRTREAARQEIVRANIRLVVSIAQRLTSRGLRLEDLVQTGIVALYETIDRHAKSKHRSRKFSTYASVRILAHLSDLIRRSGTLGITQKVLSLEGPPPAHLHMRRVLSLDSPLASEDRDEDETLGEILPDESQPPPWAGMDAAVVRARLGRALASLPTKWREVVDLRFGLAGIGPLKVEEIAMRLGWTTHVRVVQILQQAFKRLRAELETEE